MRSTAAFNMQFPKLTPLQSRFAASLVASLTLLLLYLTLNKPKFAYALELDSRIPPDHNHPILDPFDDDDDDDVPITSRSENEAKIGLRAADGVSALANNFPQNLNIEIGVSQFWTFPKDAIDGPPGKREPGLPGPDPEKRESQSVHDTAELMRRQTNRQVYISLNTCSQPTANTSDPKANDRIPPQLQMYVSQSQLNQKPGPLVDNQEQRAVKVDGGYALVTLGPENNVYIGITAPNATGFTGLWNYEIAASIDAPYHSANITLPNLYFVDSDNHAALLVTDDLTQANSSQAEFQEWMSIRPPFGVIAYPQNDAAIWGVRHSYCGLRNTDSLFTNFPTVSNQNVAQMTDRGLGGKPKEQFYVTSLNSSTSYYGWLTIPKNSTTLGNGVVGGGGKVWTPMSFNTKSLSNCALMYNLSFCSEVAYAVPTNPDLFSPTTGLPELAALYDSNAAQMYQFFNYSLQQIPCNASSSAQYSLVRNCDDCARAYKQWLCAVTIPRCEDYNRTGPGLMARNVGQPFINGSSISDLPGWNPEAQQPMLDAVATNSSRNSIIDNDIRPGPYKELLPCEDLCYDLVQSCPASLGFNCPLKGRGLEQSYGFRSGNNSNLTCSYLGAAYFLSGAERLSLVGALGKALGVVVFMVAYLSL
jgi:calcium channel MID1